MSNVKNDRKIQICGINIVHGDRYIARGNHVGGRCLVPCLGQQSPQGSWSGTHPSPWAPDSAWGCTETW